ncbi:MAG: minor capsid protein [Chthoniobacterales bacterium]|nr:minor capsid protein [Chthoniobacterales bacterium]
MTIDYSDDPRGVQLRLLLDRAKYSRWLEGETSALVEREFSRIVDLITSPRFRDLTQYQKARALELYRELGRQIRIGYTDISKFQTSELKGYAILESEVAHAQVRSLLTTEVSLSAFLPRHTLQSIAALPIQGLKLGEWFDAQARTMSLETKRIIQQGLIEGKGPLDVARRIMASDKTQGPVLVRRARNEARAVTRTAFTAVQNDAAIKSYENLPESISNSYVFMAIRDNRTSAQCRAADSRVFRYDDPKRLVPPLHISCRSSTRALILDANGKPVESPKSPHSFGSYAEWLKTQTPAEQDRILGKQQAEWWRNGKMTLADAVDADGRTLSLSALRQRLGLTKPLGITPTVRTPRMPAWQKELHQRATSVDAAPSPTQFYDKFRTDEEFKHFYAGVRDWTHNPGAVREMQDRMSAILAGKTDAAPGRLRAFSRRQEREAGALLRALGREEPTAPALFRGVGVTDNADAVLRRYSAGKEFDLAMSSFSSEETVAADFALKTATRFGDPSKQVIFGLQRGSRALPIENLSKFWIEREWLTGGRFRVVSARKTRSHVEIILEQLGVFNVR